MAALDPDDQEKIKNMMFLMMTDDILQPDDHEEEGNNLLLASVLYVWALSVLQQALVCFLRCHH